MFTRLGAAETGVKFKNILKETDDFNVLKYTYFYNGGGVAIGDINNDSLPDIYFTGNLVMSRLYLNKGDWKFDEIAQSAGVAAAGLWNTGTLMVDINGDRYLDIYVCRSAAKSPDKRRNLLFINNGDLTFSEQAAAYGLDDSGYTTHASFFDYDRDGDLDAYMLNHSTQEYAGFNKLITYFKTKTNERFGNKLYRNDDGKFIDVTKQSGIRNTVLGFGLGVLVSDVNGDNWPDIYVTNDFNEEDYLYVNQRDGTFRESLRDYFNHVSLFSMGCDGADINNDLLPDIVTLDMMPASNYRQKMSLGDENYDKYNRLIGSGFHHQTMRNMLQLNNGTGGFSEIGQFAGVAHTDWSWSALLADYDNDGWKDLYVTNGYTKNYLDMDFMNYAVDSRLQLSPEEAYSDLLANMPAITEANQMFKNKGDLTFTNVTKQWGLDLPTVSNGAAYADIDNDGDTDLVVNNINKAAHIYRNDADQLTGNNFLKIRLRGDAGNTFGIGSKVIIYHEGRHQMQELQPSRGFQSSVDYELLFGLGRAGGVDSLMVIWPTGLRQVLENVPGNQTITLSETDAHRNVSAGDVDEPLFKKSAGIFNPVFVHKENDFLDFKRDKLLPQGISRLGPKIAKGDVDGDGRFDFYFGGAMGEPGSLYLQTAPGRYSQSEQEIFNADKAYEDTDAIFFDQDRDGDLDIYVVSGGSALPAGSTRLQDRLYLNDGRGSFHRAPEGTLPEMLTSGSTVAIHDFDNDGDIDLFVGGRLIPGEYPISPRSYLLRNEGGSFSDVTAEMGEGLTTPGMVTSGEFTDMNNDGFADLVLVGEWMRILVFMNKAGKAFNRSESNGLDSTYGWWNTIHAADFDADGDMDLVAGNVGLNNIYKPGVEEPVRLVYKDFDNNGFIDPLLFYYIDHQSEFAYSRDVLLGQIASMKKTFPDYHSFARAAARDFFTEEEWVNADTLEACMFESVYVENKGNGSYELTSLPVEAQFSPIYAIASADINEDGFLDMILVGNQSLSRVSSGRWDANHGLVLTGTGTHQFNLLRPEKSGLRLRGDARGLSVDWIEDTLYLIIPMNNDSIAVYRKAF